jgi:hypothetical protein
MTNKELTEYKKLSSDDKIKLMYRLVREDKILVNKFEELIDIYISENRYKGIEYNGDCW